MLRSFLLFTLLSPTFLFAQKALTLSDAVLKAGSDYAPERIRGLQWIEGSPTYSYVKGDVLMHGARWAGASIHDRPRRLE